MSATSINSIGLLLDIAGVVLLFKYGLPADVRRDGASFLALEGDPFDSEGQKEKKKADFYDGISWCALSLLVGGFFLQIVSNFMPR